MSLAEQFDWESLLERKLVAPDPAPIREAIAGYCVLVTGAGGSIGRALVRVLAGFGARQIVMVDASEQNLFKIDAEFGAPHLSLLLNVCDRAGLRDAMRRYQPRIVFHGAAFKHVPLMERNPFAAMENNALGTLHVVQVAEEQGVERLILISTDKAADPIGIMGASKRIAELVLLSMPAPAMRMTAVRLGNVLGSEGSVFPFFLDQIAAGEPVTVTHPEVSRYFATLSETVALLLLAATERAATGVVAPDFGPPLSIAALAGKLISRRAKEHNGGSRMVFTQLRSGDKLTETLVASTESVVPVSHVPVNSDGCSGQQASGLLRVLQSPNLPWPELQQALQELRESIDQRDLNWLLRVVTALVPEYRPAASLAASQLPLEPIGQVSSCSAR